MRTLGSGVPSLITDHSQHQRRSLLQHRAKKMIGPESTLGLRGEFGSPLKESARGRGAVNCAATVLVATPSQRLPHRASGLGRGH